MSEKIHPPTPRRRQQAKEQGRGPRSGDLSSAASLLAMTCVLSWIGPSIGESLMRSVTEAMTTGPMLSIDLGAAVTLISQTAFATGWMVLPLLLATMIGSCLLHSIQSGVRVHPGKLLPDPERISPSARLRNQFSSRTFGRFAITLLKIVAVSIVAIAFLRARADELLTITALPLAEVAGGIAHLITDCCVWVATALLALAALDYALAWWHHERDLMMTDQELREEMRDAQRAAAAGPARTKAVQGVT